MNNITDLYDLFGEEIYCTICQEDCNEGDRVRTFHICLHTFHQQCIENWLIEKNICPTCRKEYLIPTPTLIPTEEVPDIDRLFLTWIIVHGVLKKNNTATLFNQHKNELRSFFSTFRYNNIKMVPVDLDNRFSLLNMKYSIATRISKYLSIEKSKIYKQPQIYQLIHCIEGISSIQALCII